MKAAVFHGPNQPLTIEEIEIDAPIGREMLVRTFASGVCHSDLHYLEGNSVFPAPAVLGHEAAGIVEATGPEVTEFAPGEHVIAVSPSSAGAASTASPDAPTSAAPAPYALLRSHRS